MLEKKDLLGLRDLSENEIMSIIELAAFMKQRVDNPKLRNNEFSNTGIITLFYENSTRTKMSFALAGAYQGADVTDLGVATSSVSKGESLVDTGVTLDQMGIDIMIMRHQMSGAAHLLARNVNASVINAGDGTNEHPSQGLLDLFTIYENKGSFKDLKVTIIGDIAHSRVARSNLFGLTKLGAKVSLAGPCTLLNSAFTELGATVTSNLKDALTDADVVMGLRMQLERQKSGAFPDLQEYNLFYGINSELLSYAKKDALLMHPGPVNRGVELSSEIIDGKHSVINVQVKNGVAVRMAIIKLLMDSKMKGGRI